MGGLIVVDDEPLRELLNKGPRHARVCVPPKGVECFWRSFGDPTARCPEHGKGQDQPDKRYFGVKTPTHRMPGGRGES